LSYVNLNYSRKRQDLSDGSHIIYNPNTTQAYLLRRGGLTVFDWDQVDGINHVNIIIDVDGDGNRTWIYNNAECSLGEDHLRIVKEKGLKEVKNKIMLDQTLNESEKEAISKIYLIQNSEAEKSKIINYINDNQLDSSN